MKKITFLLLLLSTILFMSSEPIYYYEYKPVFMKRSELEKAVRLEAATPIKNPGKIYIKDQYIFINEKYKGFHIIDNSNPLAPNQKAFLHVDGCLDIAIRGNYIYIDNAVDLLTLSANNDYSTISVSGRVRNTFPEPSSPEGYWYAQQFNRYRPKDGIIVNWEYNNQ